MHLKNINIKNVVFWIKDFYFWTQSKLIMLLLFLFLKTKLSKRYLFFSSWKPNWNMSVLHTYSPVLSATNWLQVKSISMPLRVSLCFFLTQNPNWPSSGKAQTFPLAHIKASFTPNLNRMPPYSPTSVDMVPILFNNHQSEASYWKPDPLC